MLAEIIENLELTHRMALAINAPMFDADEMLATARKIQGLIKTSAAEGGRLGIFFTPDTYYDDLLALKAGGEAAAAYIACVVLPPELATYRSEERGAEALREAAKIIKKYLTK